MWTRSRQADRQQREIKQQDIVQCSRLGASGVGAAGGNRRQQEATRRRWLQPNLRMMQLGPATVIVQFICFCRSSSLIVSNRFPSNSLWFHTPGCSILKKSKESKVKRSQHCRLDPCPGPNSVQQLLYFILLFFKI